MDHLPAERTSYSIAHLPNLELSGIFRRVITVAKLSASDFECYDYKYNVLQRMVDNGDTNSQKYVFRVIKRHLINNFGTVSDEDTLHAIRLCDLALAQS